MSNPKNFGKTVKEEMSDMSFVQNEGNFSVNKEHVFTFAPTEEEKNNKPSENNMDLKCELHEEIKQDCVLHECVKEELCVKCYGNNLKDSQESPLNTDYSDIKNFMKGYPYIEHIKEEITTEIQEGHEDIDVEDHKVESSFVSDTMGTNIDEDSIPGNSSNESGRVSVRGQKIHKRIKNYECSECQKKLSSKQGLKNHFDSLHKGIRYECNECNKLFTRMATVEAHIYGVHEKIKNYECKKCNKVFSYPGCLKLHMDYVHKGLKNHVCKECKRHFSQAANLKIHIDNIHKKIKHECEKCHKLFSDAQKLAMHIDNVHKGIKTYNCNECDECHKMFFNIISLKKHIDSFHKNIRTYECHECHKLFASVQYLKIHLEIVHRKIKK